MLHRGAAKVVWTARFHRIARIVLRNPIGIIKRAIQDRRSRSWPKVPGASLAFDEHGHTAWVPKSHLLVLTERRIALRRVWFPGGRIFVSGFENG